MADTIQALATNNIVEITLNRPDRLNSFNDVMSLALRAELEKARDDEICRAVLITGSGRSFCAGRDLNTRDPRTSNGPPDLEKSLTEITNPLVRLIRAINKPVICAVNGVAAGAGANIALACDIVLAAESANFIQSFSKVGLVPDAGGSWVLPHLIGEARAKAITMMATPVSARQAADWGMIWKAIPDENLMQEARDLACQVARGPTFGLGMTKQAIQLASDNSFDQQLDLEAEHQGRCGRSSDYAEGVTAFLEKRPAEFTGREKQNEEK